MPENVNNRTTGEKILIGFLILVGVVTLFVGSYAIGKSIKVARNSATTTVSAQDVEQLSKTIACGLDSLNSKDSLQNDILTEIKCSVDKANKELKHLEKRLNRIEKKQ